MVFLLEWRADYETSGIEAVFTTLEEAQRALELCIQIEKENPYGPMLSYWITPEKIFTTLEESLAYLNMKET